MTDEPPPTNVDAALELLLRDVDGAAVHLPKTRMIVAMAASRARLLELGEEGAQALERRAAMPDAQAVELGYALGRFAIADRDGWELQEAPAALVLRGHHPATDAPFTEEVDAATLRLSIGDGIQMLVEAAECVTGSLPASAGVSIECCPRCGGRHDVTRYDRGEAAEWVAWCCGGRAAVRRLRRGQPHVADLPDALRTELVILKHTIELLLTRGPDGASVAAQLVARARARLAVAAEPKAGIGTN